MVLLKHVKEGGGKPVFITATRFLATTSFVCQKSVELNGDSWSAIGFTTKTKKTFTEPVGGFVDGAEFVDGTLRFTVIGYNEAGYLPAWEEIVEGGV